ncbi:hypothetical protein [Paractinoplanes atraurantiacus]|uniref:Secreted protein n=1 Tax=Paractinoplanes atraurantiacus TaxID=1036182 RepID=A0A285JPJ7_9ACTN|nr:hypothetical protein [Actinoplanes atraurantiacus]SNY62224.1 hypothetical protein SAMN05421748_123106 [Actinoplanes atraurantiacus]
MAYDGGAAVLSLMAAALLAAPTPGGLAFDPPASIDTAAIKVRTSAACPKEADSYYAQARGHGFPAAGLTVTAPTAAGISYTSGFDVYFAQTMKDFAVDNHTTLTGLYDVSVYCVDSFTGTKFAEFKGALIFTSPTRFRASGAPSVPAAPSAPASAEATAAPARPSTDLAAAAPSAKSGIPVAWIAGALAAVLAAFEAGRRFGRRTATR